jgi:hypothetical protein
MELVVWEGNIHLTWIGSCLGSMDPAFSETAVLVRHLSVIHCSGWFIILFGV